MPILPKTATDSAIRAAFAALLALASSCRQIVGIESGGGSGCDNPSVIDDLEDGDTAICDSQGRHGAWYAVGDGTGTIDDPVGGVVVGPTAIPGGRDGSRLAMRLRGSGFTDWGALLGLNLNVVDASVVPYDATAVGGIRFWMKAAAPEVSVSVALPETTPASRGGTCADGPRQWNCDNAFSFTIEAPPDEWQEYAIPFTALSQPFTRLDDAFNVITGSAAWNASRLLNVQFAVAPPAAPSPVAFDVWIDDVAFFSCSTASCVPTCVDPAAPKACPGSSPALPAACYPAGTDCQTAPVASTLFDAVWGTGPSDVWVSGLEGPIQSGVVLHWDGGAWSASGTSARLRGIGGRARNDVWAVGDFGAALHFDGAQWSELDTGTLASLRDVWTSDPDSVWAVGQSGAVAHGNGVSWILPPNVPQFSGTLNGVWGSGPGGDVWIAGAGNLLRWDGATLSIAPVTGVPKPVIFDVSGTSASDVWAVGLSGLILHFDGMAWSEVASGTDQDLWSVWASGPGPGDVWAVGAGGSILHFDGGAWSVVPSGTSEMLLAVWASGPDDAWAVSPTGHLVLRWDGSVWRSVSIDPAILR